MLLVETIFPTNPDTRLRVLVCGKMKRKQYLLTDPALIFPN